MEGGVGWTSSMHKHDEKHKHKHWLLDVVEATSSGQGVDGKSR
jgi:hypothetical protein